MLHRQKALLAILQQVGGQASTLQMMKWAFLLGQEGTSQGGKTFYQFLPYRFGPYSFALNREADTLIHNGFVEKVEKNFWKLTTLGREQILNLPKQISQDISNLTQQYGNFSGSDLIKIVYANYSWFTVNSDLRDKRREQRPIAEIEIYTAGYEGRSVDEFLNLLMRSGIQRLIDVRYNPISRRYGYHKSTLNRLCNALDIEYKHLSGLGIPGSARRDLDSINSYLSLFQEYRCGLVNRQKDLQIAISLLNSKPSVLVCMEANPQYCHRNVLAQHLMNMTGLSIKHLGHE